MGMAYDALKRRTSSAKRFAKRFFNWIARVFLVVVLGSRTALAYHGKYVDKVYKVCSETAAPGIGKPSAVAWRSSKRYRHRVKDNVWDNSPFLGYLDKIRSVREAARRARSRRTQKKKDKCGGHIVKWRLVEYIKGGDK